VLNYDDLVKEEGYKTLHMELKVTTSNGLEVTTTRCPISVDGQQAFPSRGAPALGEHNELIEKEFIHSKLSVGN
jgi:crotonobetainyl-CoA:carnitine CoA-transferase CaiB-like acyl-CoA transferase